VGMELTTLLVVGTDKISRCKSNYMYVQGYKLTVIQSYMYVQGYKLTVIQSYMYVQGYKLTVIQSHSMTKIELGDLEVGNYLVIVFRVEDIFSINPRKYQIKNNEQLVFPQKYT
jgi:hypothetical protein